MDLGELLQKLPHAFPFRMVDRLIEVEPGKRAIGLKNVSIDEPYFSGHFPKTPILPGVLIVEALAQLGGLAIHSAQQEEEGTPFLAAIDRFRFRRKVVPGDQLILEAEVVIIFSGLAKVKVLARAGGEIVADGELILGRVRSD